MCTLPLDTEILPDIHILPLAKDSLFPTIYPRPDISILPLDIIFDSQTFVLYRQTLILPTDIEILPLDNDILSLEIDTLSPNIDTLPLDMAVLPPDLIFCLSSPWTSLSDPLTLLTSPWIPEQGFHSSDRGSKVHVQVV